MDHQWLQNNFALSDGVYQSKDDFKIFEDAYIKVREKEHRVLNIAQIRQLPFVAKNNPDFDLWEIRRKNLSRFLNYLSKKKQCKILDVGCGNGFFVNAMAVQQHQVIGMDINLTELKQAAEAFPLKNIAWLKADIFDAPFLKTSFDIITFCTSFHYFKESDKLIRHCLSMLNPGGEIHIIDSPFYDNKQLNLAKLNSEKYYQQMGVPEMTGFFHHISFTTIKTFNPVILYQPKPRLNKILRRKDSPFYWIKIIK